MARLEPPARLAHLPRDKRGSVVPWATGWVDGEPALGTNSAAHVARCVIEGLCGICGQGLDYWIAFLGDEECVTKREFMEPPMHEECARYSIAVCPYLASAHYESGRQRPGVIQIADRSRPERMAIYITRSFTPSLGDLPVSKAAPPKRLEWV